MKFVLRRKVVIFLETKKPQAKQQIHIFYNNQQDIRDGNSKKSMQQQKQGRNSRKQSLKNQAVIQHSTNRNQQSTVNSNNNNNRQPKRNSNMDEDDVVKQLMFMLGNKKQLQIRSADGKMIKLSVDIFQELDDCSLDANLENQLNNANFQKDSSAQPLQQDSQEFKRFQKILEDASHQNLSNSQLLLPIKSNDDQQTLTSSKKVSLSSKRTKITATNSAVLEFIDTNSKKTVSNSLVTTSQTIIKKTQKLERPKDATQSIQFLKQNHPQDQQHLEIISKRMLELEKMEQDKMKLDEEISSILSASFSNSISGVRFDNSNSIDASLISLSALSISGANDPLCQIFSNYMKRTSISKKSNTEKMPSFLFLYSQPMIDPKGNEINDQINYFEEQSIIQKTLKQCKIDYIKQQGTVEKFNYWITQNISIIHYCGHGVPNYLLFEGPAGSSVKFDGEKLEKILKQLINPLQLVFVASCHSESTGQIFKKAGAVHVICIKDKFQILDEACHEFTRIFYRSCINDKMTICDAFNFAKKQIILSEKFSSHQCAKFMLIKDHCENNCQSKLDIAKQGEFRDLTYKPYYCKFIPSRVQNFIPRPRDLHEILKLIENRNRFISVIGHSGIGKSTLVRQLVRYIQFRNILKDGVVYLDIRSCEKMLKIFQVFTMELFESSPGKLNKTFGENAQRIVKQIYQKEVLIVMDNCQNIMLSQDKNQFKKLIETIMKNCDNVYFVFTNRSGIGRQIDYCAEKLYELQKLNDSQAETLFFLRVPRKIEKNQLQQFLKIADVTDFLKHPFFQFLNGHPEAICMTASLLSDRSLSQLYQLLMKPSLKNELPKQKPEEQNMGVNPLVQTAMKISLNVLKNKYKDSSEMIKTLSLLPVGADSQMMSKLFGTKWKEASKRLIDHSLVIYREMGGSKYYSVHPYIIIYVQSQINNDEKLKIHQKISQQFLKRIQKVYRHVGTLSQSSQRAQQQFFTEQQNYKAIILRQLSFYGEKSKIKKLYYNLFQADYSDDQYVQREEETVNVKLKSQAIEGINKKRVYNQKMLQPTKKDSITLMLVQYVTILFVTKNPTCTQFLQCGIVLSRMKNKLISEANLLRIKACLYLTKNKCLEAKDCFLKSWELYAIEGCGLGAASCQSAVGYLRLIEEQYAPAKKNMENALKYYDQIAHPFGKHYLNRWLCNLKTKMNRTQKQLFSHRQEAQKLLKEAKVSLKSNNIHNTSLVKHKLGIFVFRFTFDNISLFLQTSFQVDVKPRIINQVALKKTQERGSKFHDDFLYNNEDEQILVSLNKNQKNQIVKKNPYKRK